MEGHSASFRTTLNGPGISVQEGIENFDDPFLPLFRNKNVVSHRNRLRGLIDGTSGCLLYRRPFIGVKSFFGNCCRHGCPIRVCGSFR